jgi:hypothetical protein
MSDSQHIPIRQAYEASLSYVKLASVTPVGAGQDQNGKGLKYLANKLLRIRGDGYRTGPTSDRFRAVLNTPIL